MLAEVSSGEISAGQTEGHSVTLNTGLESFDDAGTPGHMQTNQMLDGQEMPGELWGFWMFLGLDCVMVMDFCHTRPYVLQEASNTLQSLLQCLSV